MYLVLGLLSTRPFLYDAMKGAVYANLDTISQEYVLKGTHKKNTLHKVAESMKAGHSSVYVLWFAMSIII